MIPNSGTLYSYSDNTVAIYIFVVLLTVYSICQRCRDKIWINATRTAEEKTILFNRTTLVLNEEISKNDGDDNIINKLLSNSEKLLKYNAKHAVDNGVVSRGYNYIMLKKNV